MLSIFLLAIEDHSYDNKFAEIYYEFEEFAYKIAYDILKDSRSAEDAVQDAFLGIAANIKNVDTEDKEKLKIYVAVTVRNASVNILRRSRQEEQVAEITEALSDDAIDIEEKSEIEEALRDIIAALNDLPLIYRDALTYRYLIGLSARAIAELLKLPEATVRSRIRNGLARLKNDLKEKRS